MRERSNGDSTLYALLIGVDLAGTVVSGPGFNRMLNWHYTMAEFGERREDEAAQVQARGRQREKLRLLLGVAIEQHVDASQALDGGGHGLRHDDRAGLRRGGLQS